MTALKGKSKKQPFKIRTMCAQSAILTWSMKASNMAEIWWVIFRMTHEAIGQPCFIEIATKKCESIGRTFWVYSTAANGPVHYSTSARKEDV